MNLYTKLHSTISEYKYPIYASPESLMTMAENVLKGELESIVLSEEDADVVRGMILEGDFSGYKPVVKFAHPEFGRGEFEEYLEGVAYDCI